MRITRLLAKTTAAALLVSGMSLAGAGSASADQIWHQSIGRASATESCAASSAADTAAGWSPWAASWDRWPNADRGGFVCNRSITWAHDSRSYPSAGCLYLMTLGTNMYENFRVGTNMYVDFQGGWVLPSAPVYSDSSCTQLSVYTLELLVYAPGDYDPVSLCAEAFGPAYTFTTVRATNIYQCWNGPPG